MAKTAETIQKIPTECVDTINTYASLIHTAFVQGKENQREEMSRKLRGYLTCLVDLGKLKEADLRNIYLWVISGHWVGEKAGLINDT